MAKSESEEKIRFVVFTSNFNDGRLAIPISEITEVTDLSETNDGSKRKTFIHTRKLEKGAARNVGHYVCETFDEVIAILAAELNPKPKPRSVNDWLIAIYIRLRGLG